MIFMDVYLLHFGKKSYFIKNFFFQKLSYDVINRLQYFY